MPKDQNVYHKIAANIRKYRKAKDNMSQEDLGLAAGLNRAYVGYIERGERRPSVETLASIAKVLEVELYKLFVFE